MKDYILNFENNELNTNNSNNKLFKINIDDNIIIKEYESLKNIKFKTKIFNYTYNNKNPYIIILLYSSLNLYSNNDITPTKTNYEFIKNLLNTYDKIQIWKKIKKINTENINEKEYKKDILKYIQLIDEKKSTFFESFITHKNNKSIKNIQLKQNILNQNEQHFDELKISKEKYKHIEYNNKHYLYTNNFWSILHVIKYNENNDKSISFKSNAIIKTITEKYIKIDWTLYKKLLNFQLKTNNFSNIEEAYESKKKIIEKTKRSKEDLKLYNKITSLIDSHNFYIRYKNYDGKIYLSFSFDFRGRIYWDHTVSHTNSKITRNSIIYDYEENNFSSSKTNDILQQYIPTLENLNIKYTLLSHQNKLSIIWILISLGYIHRDKKKKKLSTTDLIITAHNNLDNNIDTLETIKLKYIYKTYMQNPEEIKTIHTLSKDATASGLQNICRITNNNNQETLKHLNMNDEHSWYDTYTYIIDSFIESHNIPQKYHNILNRNTLKKTIMIENYGAKYLNCLTDFLTKINTQHNIIDIKLTFKKFFNYLRTDNNKFISFNLPITYEDIHTNDSIININYYNKSKKQLSVTTNKKRTTIQQITNNTKINKTKTNSSFKANITHIYDAEIVRRMYYNYNSNFHTIHDCYILPINHISTFIDKLNTEMEITPIPNINLNIKIYSFYIII